MCRPLRWLCLIVLLALPACSDEGRIAPQDPTVDPNEEIQRGWELFRARDFHSAADLFRRVIENRPNAAAGYIGLGWCEIEVDSIANACETLERAVALSNDVDGFAGLAAAASALGRDSTAVEASLHVSEESYIFIGDPSFSYTDVVFIRALGLFHLLRYEECLEALQILDPYLEIDLGALDFRELLFNKLQSLRGDV